MIPPSINEQSTSAVTFTLADKDGVPASPSTVTYRMDCLTTGTPLVEETVLVGPGPQVKLDMSSQDNRIIDQNNVQEYKRLTIRADYADGARLTSEFDWVVNNLKFIS